MVYFEYMTYIVQHTGNLALLDSSLESDLEECPSWVPDFRYLSARTSNADPPTRSKTSWTTDGRVLEVEGVKVSRVLRYAQHSDDAYHDMVQFNDGILKPSADIRGMSH